MARKREIVEVFGVAFVDVVTCGLGAVFILMTIFSALEGEFEQQITTLASVRARKEQGLPTPSGFLFQVDAFGPKCRGSERCAKSTPVQSATVTFPDRHSFAGYGTRLIIFRNDEEPPSAQTAERFCVELDTGAGRPLPDADAIQASSILVSSLAAGGWDGLAAPLREELLRDPTARRIEQTLQDVTKGELSFAAWNFAGMGFKASGSCWPSFTESSEICVDLGGTRPEFRGCGVDE